MADDEEDKLLEVELELQLREQRDSITDLKEALVSDPNNPELVSVYEELVQAIKEAEEGIFHLKRARLLREADSILQDSKYIAEDVKAEPLDPTQIGTEPLEDQGYNVGSKCRFRHTDGRWYNGLIIELEGSDLAKISFLTPTSENMLICKFFLQQRCRFGTNCRLSHGLDIPLSSLKKYIPTAWDQSLVGSSIWAVCDVSTGIWREAELESWDDERRTARVVFGDDGVSAKLGSDSMTLSKYAQEENDSSSGQSDGGSEYEGGDSEETTAIRSGVQTETAIFATWENHTRGIASKMMASMGYREGMGLGVSGQGMVDPISVKVVPRNCTIKNEERKAKKRSRGGKRAREKKFAAAAAKAAEEEEESRPDVFSLINTQLAMHCEDANEIVEKKGNKGKKEDRRAILAYDDEVKELRTRVEKLEEMARRNRNEKVVYEAAMRKMNETRKLLEKAEEAHASATSAVVSKEREKRWLKF